MPLDEAGELERLEVRLRCFISDDLREQLAFEVRSIVGAMASKDLVGVRREVWNLWMLATEAIVEYAESLSRYGVAKKKAVMSALGYFYDHVLQPLDLPFIPAGVEYIVDQMARSFLLGMADVMIDRLVSLFNRLDHFEHPQKLPAEGA